MTYQYDAGTIKKAMNIVEASDKWCEATIELNGHHINLSDGADYDMLELLCHHQPTLRKMDELASLLADVIKDARDKPPSTDTNAA